MDVQRKIVTAVSAGIAGFIATRVVTAAWKGVTKREAPEDPSDLTFSTVEAAGFAALLAAAVSVAQTIASRRALVAVAKREADTVAKAAPKLGGN